MIEQKARESITIIVNKHAKDSRLHLAGGATTSKTLEGSHTTVFTKMGITVVRESVAQFFQVPFENILTGSARSVPTAELIDRLLKWNLGIFLR